ncbi:MAG: hypothetical protein A3B37_01555 [Candidatus Sungbacteria bacterium RIFCSPLOWO2_01_FULL_59_16]|uniref:Uncharacterized protein n=1 Tax=Candidatus Sungbacteria bacterium RIFCSPLOWO2_01_FULL_59_16 TaxID=1802280 RepID=A0A1G2LC44_9BACT|nr:MAG: hypothetical protein A3B37_01555 [Candidatus Sungbacteria bacterium RIFCSPLOWO2_01_FULL_59_16]
MKRILWLSQHRPLSRQIAELRWIFGEVEVLQDVNPFSSAEDIVQRVRDGGYDETVVVAPLSVIAKLCELGLRPLWAEMEQVVRRGEADVAARGRFYRFVKFRRIKAVRLEFEELG